MYGRRRTTKAARNILRGGAAAVRNVVRPYFPVAFSTVPKVAKKTGKAQVNMNNKVRPTRRVATRRPRVLNLTTLSKRVSTISKELKGDQSILEYHYRSSGRQLVSVAQMAFNSLESVNVVKMESALGQLRFFNPAAPGTLTTADGSTGTYAREYMFKTIYSNIAIYNNYQVPVKVRLYCLSPKLSTSTAPETAFTNGLTDAGNPSSTSPAIYPTDSQEFTDTYSILTSKMVVLQPAQSMSMSKSFKDVGYCPQIYDSDTSTYQKRYKNLVWATRIEGILGHDTAANQQTLVAAGIDFLFHAKFVIQYESGGAALKTIYVNENCPTSFTNGGVLSEKPIADNIGYSVA